MNIAQLKLKLPSSPGVYLMMSSSGEVLYVGKAVNLKRRVLSYFEKPQERRIQAMIAQVERVRTRDTSTAIEALILESQLIKQYQPRYNIKEKDDKSFLFVVITRESFPRVLLVRGKDLSLHQKPLAQFGPFTSASALRAAMDILRKIFPWSDHSDQSQQKNPCFNYQIGLCPGVCVGLIEKMEYRIIIRQLMLFFRGKKQRIIRDMKVLMRLASREERYEDAAIFRKRLFALTHIEDVALINRDEIISSTVPHRVEGYDISNISGTSAVGSMVVFTDGFPDKSQYRKFCIKTVRGANDIAMLREVITRRFGNDWPRPDIILVDGGLPQVNAVRSVLHYSHLTIPVVGIAKGPERKRNDFIIPSAIRAIVLENRTMFIRVRDESHRFAINYHRKLRNRIAYISKIVK